MALPTRTEIITMDFSANGSPFCFVASKSGQDGNGMDYSDDGSPFWFTPVAVAAGNIEAIGGETYATDVAKVGGFSKADIAKIGGIDSQ